MSTAGWSTASCRPNQAAGERRWSTKRQDADSMFVGASNRRPSWFESARYRAVLIPQRNELGSASPGFLPSGFLPSGFSSGLGVPPVGGASLRRPFAIELTIDGTLGVRIAQLQSQNPYIRRRFDPDTDLVTADANDGQDDIVSQVNSFGFFSCQNQHDLNDSSCFRTSVVASRVPNPSLG